MVSARLLAIAVVALCPGLTAAYPEPHIFYNLTIEEFQAKRWEYQKRSLRNSAEAAVDQDSAVEHPSYLRKRVPVLHEVDNNAGQQAVVELRSLKCASKFGVDHRAISGSCPKSRPNQMNLSCQLPGSVRNPIGAGTRLEKKTSEWCKKPTVCRTIVVRNFIGNTVHMPYCADVIEINKRENDADVVPAYEGQKTIYDAEAGPSDPSTVDTFWRIYGEFEALTGNFDYRGRSASGQTFRAVSPKQVSSWCCMGCPPGTLYAETIGFKSQAVGFTVPATLL